MCELTTFLSAALSAAKAVSSFSAQQAQFRAEQRRFQERQKQIRANTIAGFDEAQRKREAERVDVIRRQEDVRRESLEAREAGRTRAGETGLSFRALERDLGARVGRELSASTEDYRRFSRDVDLELEDVSRTGQTQLTNLRAPTPPNPGDLFFRIAGLGAKAVGRAL